MCCSQSGMLQFLLLIICFLYGTRYKFKYRGTGSKMLKWHSPYSLHPPLPVLSTHWFVSFWTLSVFTTREGLFCGHRSRPTLLCPCRGREVGRDIHSLPGACGPLSRGRAPVGWLPFSGSQNCLLPLPFHPGMVTGRWALHHPLLNSLHPLKKPFY